MKLTKYNYHKVFGLKLDIKTKAILDYVLSYATNGIAYPSQERLGSELGLCRQTIAKHMKSLETIKINGMPFIVIEKSRKSKKGTWTYNRYIFKWLIAPELYQRENTKELLNKLQEEYIELVMQENLEIEDTHNHRVNFFNISNYRQKSFLSIDQIKQYINNLSTKLGINKADVLQVLCNIGHEVNENKTQIYHLEKYLLKSFRKAGLESKIKETMKSIYLTFFDKNEDALFCTDWEGLYSII